MVKRVALDVRSDRTVAGKLENRVLAYTWAIDEERGLVDPQVETVAFEHRIPTKPLFSLTSNLRASLDEEVAKYRAELERKLGKEHTLASNAVRLEGPFGLDSDYHVYHLVTPFVDKGLMDRHLSARFIKNEYNTRMLSLRRAFAIPFGILDDGKPTKQFADLETMLKAPMVAIDFETKNWQKLRVADDLEDYDDEQIRERYERLAGAFDVAQDPLQSYWGRRDFVRGIERILNDNRDQQLTVATLYNVTAGQAVAITTLDCGVDELDVDMPDGSGAIHAKVEYVADQLELIARTNEVIQEMQPAYLTGHNHLKFDYHVASEFTDDGFFPGVDGSAPRWESGIAVTPEGKHFIQRRDVPGRQSVDMSLFAQQYMFLPNNKLDTVARHVLGIRAKKTMTHDELAANTRLAEEGDTDVARDIVFYAVQDVLKSGLLGQACLIDHLLISRASRSPLSRVDATAKHTLASEHWVHRKAAQSKTHPTMKLEKQRAQFGEDRVSFEDFTARNAFERFWKKQTHSVLSKKGAVGACLVQFHPFAPAFRDLLCEDPYVAELNEAATTTRDVKQRSRLFASLESLCAYPLFKAFDANYTDFYFGLDFNCTSDARRLYRNSVLKSLQSISTTVQENTPYNWRHALALFPEDVDREALDILVHENVATIFGSGNFLSCRTGRFAGFVNGELWQIGIADPLSRKVYRNDIGQQLTARVLQHMLVEDDLHSALVAVDAAAKRIAAEDYTLEEATVIREARRSAPDYSSMASGPVIDQIITEDARQGDEVRKTLSVADMQRRYFGIYVDHSGLFASVRSTGSTGNVSELIGLPFIDCSKAANHLRTLYAGLADGSTIDTLMTLHSGC